MDYLRTIGGSDLPWTEANMRTQTSHKDSSPVLRSAMSTIMMSLPASSQGHSGSKFIGNWGH